jgi:hypothetical protein
MIHVCRRLIWPGYAARLKETKPACSMEFWWIYLFGNVHFETRDGDVILIWMLGRQVVLVPETRKSHKPKPKKRTKTNDAKEED